jgi:glycosyltransferase involved in cell wall biosynthesis
MTASLLLTVLAAATLVVWMLTVFALVYGNSRIRFLTQIAPASAPAPRVSVIVAARDEERGIEPALASLLRQDYAALEVVVVDDRSSDRTGEILRRMSAGEPRLHVVTVESLPDGWLGKNHALQLGAGRATGEILLFTDADIVMEPSTVARAVGYLERERLDHVAVAPELKMPGPLLDLFGGVFAVFFAQYARPWLARDPRSSAHIGIGAFNMVRARAYHAAGGHAPIAMRPDDDMKLGKLLKQNGFRQDVLFGRGLVSVEWYSSFGEVVRGLEKNSFAGLDYSVVRVVGSAVVLLALNVLPWVALLLTSGAAWWLNAGSVLLMVALFAASSRASGANPLLGVGFPIATLLFIYILVRATVLTLRNGGIRWRDTHYPLEQLRANRV